MADHGSFSRASSIIGVAQPTLVRQVQRLEEDCGAKLFYWLGRGVTLRPEGELFAERVRPLLQKLRVIAPGIRLNFLTGYSGYVHEWMVDGRESVSLEELEGLPMALPSRSHGLRRTLD